MGQVVEFGTVDRLLAAQAATAQAHCGQKARGKPGRPARVEHEYARAGALAYLAAGDVHALKVFGRCEPTTGIDALA